MKHFRRYLYNFNGGLEVHPTTDQFLRMEGGQGLVQMGDSKDQLDFEEQALDDYAVMIPAEKCTLSPIQEINH